MVKKVAIAIVAAIVVLAIGLSVGARAVFTKDGVRVALAQQLAKQLGQPVTVGGISAGIYPRVTVTLRDVAIGDPVHVHVGTLDIGTDFRALLSRRIEHASLHLNGARIDLPLPPLTFGSSASSGHSPAVEIVSVEEVVLRGVEIVSGGRMLTGDVEVVPHGNALDIRKITLSAEDMSIAASGKITDMAGPTGELAIKAGTLNLDKLLAFVNDFSTGSGVATTSARPRGTAAETMNMAVSLEAKRAAIGSVAIDKLSGRAVLRGENLNLDPLAFNLFGGRYEGSLGVKLGADAPAFAWKARVSHIDVGAVAAFGGNPNTITGRLDGTIDVGGRGSDAAAAMKTARGTARIDITNGVIHNLGLVRTVVAATSLNAEAVRSAATGSRDEPFSRLGGTLTIASGYASTQDLRLESKDLTTTLSGALRLDGSAVNLQGAVQLSDELSRQAGSAVLRVSQQNGRVTVPVVITGVAGNYAVKVDTAAAARRAIQNEAGDRVEKAIKKGLSDLFKK